MRRHHGTDLGGGQDLREAPAALLGCGGGSGSRTVQSRPRVERRRAPRRVDLTARVVAAATTWAPARRREAVPRQPRCAPHASVPEAVDWNARTCSLLICGVARRVVFGRIFGRSLKLLVSYKAARFAEPPSSYSAIRCSDSNSAEQHSH